MLPSTLHEIDLIQEQFVKVVAGMFHHRLDYPGNQAHHRVPRQVAETGRSPDPRRHRAPPRQSEPPEEVREEQLPLEPAEEG